MKDRQETPTQEDRGGFEAVLEKLQGGVDGYRERIGKAFGKMGPEMAKVTGEESFVWLTLLSAHLGLGECAETPEELAWACVKAIDDLKSRSDQPLFDAAEAVSEHFAMLHTGDGVPKRSTASVLADLSAALEDSFYRERNSTEDLSGVRPVVAWFAQEMERQLRANDHKPGWAADHRKALLRRLREETAELEAAPFDQVLKEAADVANFAMMIADNASLGNRDGAPSPLASNEDAKAWTELLYAAMRAEVALREVGDSVVGARAQLTEAIEATRVLSPFSSCPGPDFKGFAAALREEITWVRQLHADDKSGQARADVESLSRLLEAVEAVGESVGLADERSTLPPKDEDSRP